MDLYIPPVNRIPEELFIEIVIDAINLEALPELSEYTAPQKTFSMTIRFIRLSHVCRYWRHILLNCPFLWGHLPTYDWSHPRDELLRMVLQRSGTSPLSFLCVSPSKKPPPSTTLSISVLIHHYGPRIRRLDIYGNSIRPGDLASLWPAHLEVLHYPHYDPEFLRPLKALLERCSHALQALSVHSHCPAIPMPYLTHIHMSVSQSVNDFKRLLSLLSGLSGLEYMYLGDSSSGDQAFHGIPTHSSSPPVELLRLRSSSLARPSREQVPCMDFS